MTQAQHGKTVKVHYTGKLTDGTVFDSSLGRDPLELTLGERNVIAGFEEALVGMQAGETKVAHIAPDEAYGPRDDRWMVDVERAEIPEDLDPKVGDRLQVEQANGKLLPVWVRDITDSRVTLDANHPLAGHELIFELEVIEVE
jgi:peptidylprolyl isomerase